ncbi:MAG: DUF6434 domain-containing protein [Lysinibacillus sp.]
MRPILHKDLDVEEFQQYYWLKEELQAFCREHKLSASGSKIDIAERIAVFLQTGERLKPRSRKRQPARKGRMETELSLDTVISENHRCSQQVRAFFTSVIPNFHFSTYIQQFFRENAGRTYRDVVDAWQAEEERKKDPSYIKKKLAPQFEYNQFIRDYFADPHNKGRTREDAIHAWKVVKSMPGDNRYRPTKHV